MIIRAANLTDKEDIGSLVEEFHKESLKDYGISFDIECAKTTFMKHYKSSLVLEDKGKVIGAIIGTLVKHGMDTKEAYQEMMWFVTKSHRRYGIKLLKALETKCKEEGIGCIVMGHMTTKKSEKMERLYDRLGYKMLEVQYMKTLS